MSPGWTSSAPVFAPARRLVAASVMLAVLGSGCYSTTHIYSKPSRATATIDNNYLLGKTPIALREQVWVWTRHAVTVSKEGYQPTTISIGNQGLNIGYAALCVCSLGVLLPFLFVSSYPGQYVVRLEPKTPTAAAAPMKEHAAASFSE